MLSTLSRGVQNAFLAPLSARLASSVSSSNFCRSLPDEALRAGGLGLLGCSPKFFKEWATFQLEESGDLTWSNRGTEWDFARMEAGVPDPVLEEMSEDERVEYRLQEYERNACYGRGGLNCSERALELAMEAGHWSSFYPKRKSDASVADYATRSTVLRRFLALRTHDDEWVERILAP